MALGALVLVVGGIGIGLAVLGAILVLLALIELVGQIERREHVAGEPAEGLLVLQGVGHAVEQVAGAFLDPGTPQIDQGPGSCGWRRAGQPLAHEE
ncbi:hypothetical protein AUC71_02655 [Methyloceanibacter marginalis]|uniref:Uncharacterized protein n=1 Tax=Methyloceanibacter marginalis TaxID=1774971 RepID=A0A1E3W8A5_9HYPH|nr:hypothetical protein AUC71_02655 [Methyloceanibacter marginalis]